MRVNAFPRLLTLACLTAAGACAVSSTTPVSGPVPVVSGDAASFVPLVVPSVAGGRCVPTSDASVPAGARAVAMRYPGPPERQVTVTVSDDGTPIRYIDVRGDLSESDGDVGDRTTIGLYLEQGYAVLSNRVASDAPDMLEVPVEDVVTSPRLGNPEGLMTEVLARCDAVS